MFNFFRRLKVPFLGPILYFFILNFKTSGLVIIIISIDGDRREEFDLTYLRV